MAASRRSAPQRPRRLARLGLAAALLVAIAGPPPIAEACMWTPPPPFCGKTLVLSHAVPQVLLLPGGGIFDVESLVFFDLWDFPTGTGLCPAGPYTVDIDYTLTCTGGGDGAGSATGLALGNGFNPYTVPVTVPAGPPRLCSLAGVASVTLADGMMLEASPKNMPTCIAEPAPGLPTEPRVDLFLTSGNPIAAVQPGDQAGHTYRIVNNDPAESYSGTLTVDMVSTSKMPTSSGPMPPGTGVFSISDPGPGDNFPIGFDHHLFNGCLPFPPDPMTFTESLIDQPILLPPGGFIDIDIFSRPWGMCKNGSCGQASLVLDGDFSDLSTGLACAGFVTAADIAAPPLYLWPDSGQVVQMLPPIDPLAGVLPFQGIPLPGPPLGLELHLQALELQVAGVPAPGVSDQLSGPFTGPDHGRTRTQFTNGGNPVSLPPQTLDLVGQLQILPPLGAPIQPEIVELHLIGGPTGFEQIAPGMEALVGILPAGQPEPASFFDLTLQLNGVGVDENGERRDLLFSLVELIPISPNSFDFHLVGTVAPGTGTQILTVELNVDLHGFGFEAPIPLVFQDGFENGGTSAWTLTFP